MALRDGGRGIGNVLQDVEQGNVVELSAFPVNSINRALEQLQAVSFFCNSYRNRRNFGPIHFRVRAASNVQKLTDPGSYIKQGTRFSCGMKLAEPVIPCALALGKFFKPRIVLR